MRLKGDGRGNRLFIEISSIDKARIKQRSKNKEEKSKNEENKIHNRRK